MTTHRSPVAALALITALFVSACADASDTAIAPSDAEAETTTLTEPADSADSDSSDSDSADPDSAGSETGGGSASSAPQSADVAPAATGPHQDLLAEALGKRDGGIVVLTRRDGETTSSAIGMANADGEAMTTGHQFRVGSISKPFVAVMILQLAEEGELNLDAPLGAYLVDTPVGHDVTLDQLLSHRSGIANYTDLPSFAQVINDPSLPTTPAAMVDLAAAAESKAPGQEFSYSNTNYLLLGQLLEAIDGKPLNESLAARITGPLGMNETFFASPDGPEPTLLAKPWSLGRYGGKADSPYVAWETGAWAAGALVSTPDDLSRFLQGLADGELLEPDTLAAMTDFEARPDYSYGLAEIELGDDNPGWGHGGGLPGFLSLMGYSPESGDLGVVLTNNDSIDPGLVAEELVADWG